MTFRQSPTRWALADGRELLFFTLPGHDWSEANSNWNDNTNSYDIFSAGPDGKYNLNDLSDPANRDNIGNFSL